MTDNITPLQPEFYELCKSLGVEYPTSVHHFEKDQNRVYIPVIWSNDINKEKR